MARPVHYQPTRGTTVCGAVRRAHEAGANILRIRTTTDVRNVSCIACRAIIHDYIVFPRVKTQPTDY